MKAASTEDLLDKREVARRQIDGAIKFYMVGGDPVVVCSLLAPASQILRDLNKSNPLSISHAITVITQESGIRPGLFWKEFNASAAALKHASASDEQVDERTLIERQAGEMMFCIAEYIRLNENGCGRMAVTNLMHAFIQYHFRAQSRTYRAAAAADIINWIDSRIIIAYVVSRQMFLIRSLAFLEWIKTQLPSESESKRG